MKSNKSCVLLFVCKNGGKIQVYIYTLIHMTETLKSCDSVVDRAVFALTLQMLYVCKSCYNFFSWRVFKQFDFMLVLLPSCLILFFFFYIIQNTGNPSKNNLLCTVELQWLEP